MTNLTAQIKNNNEAQKAYRTAVKKNIELSKKIQRALLDQPVVGTWAHEGSEAHFTEMLEEILAEIKDFNSICKSEK